MLAGSKVVLLYADGCMPFSRTSKPRTPTLDSLSSQGVSGWLALRRPADSGYKPGVALAQLLGVMPERLRAAEGEMKEICGFERESNSVEKSVEGKFGGMQIRVMTNQPKALELKESIGLQCEMIDVKRGDGDCNNQFVSPSGDCLGTVAESITTGIKQHLEGSTELVLVHLDAECEIIKLGENRNNNSRSEEDERTHHCLDLLEQVAHRVWGDLNMDVLQCVLVGGRSSLEEGPMGLQKRGATEAQMANYTPRKKRKSDQEDANGVLGSTPALIYLRPTQSSCMHNGRQLDEETDGMEQKIFYSVHHPTATRRDEVLAFDTDQIQENGGNGGSLVQHWLMEIAAQLGRLPKYGA